MKKNDRYYLYRNVKDSLLLYWNIYGGLAALLKSPYLHLAIIASFFCFPIWATPQKPYWYNLPLSTLPNLLGFTLGGYAILLAFGNEKFLMILCAKDASETSPFMNVSGAFVHFIIVQALAFFLSIFALCWGVKSGIFAFVGFTFFLYSLLTGVAAAFAVLRLGKWYDIFLDKKYKENLRKGKEEREQIN